jgi:hypothetical protein
MLLSKNQSIPIILIRVLSIIFPIPNNLKISIVLIIILIIKPNKIIITTILLIILLKTMIIINKYNCNINGFYLMMKK